MAALAPGTPTARLDAEILLAHVLGTSRAGLVAGAGRALDAAARDAFRTLAARRAAGEPVAYLVGRREFWSLDLEVTPDTLVPRPETEHLVEAVLDALAPHAPAAVADLGTGSGAVAIAVARERPRCRVIATDRSRAALAVAARNAARLGAANVEIAHGDWCAALDAAAPGVAFDVVACNPPYVADADPCLAGGELAFEPRTALAAGPRGLEAIERVADEARMRLASGGRLLLEHGADQGAAVRAWLARLGYDPPRTRRDLAGHERVTEARWPGSAGALAGGGGAHQTAS